MGLLDLPLELLTLIAGHLGALELRPLIEYLLVSKHWYKAILPVYLSHLSLSDLCLSSRDLERLPPLQSPLSDFIAERVRRLSIRLVGHPSQRIARDPWMTHKREGDDDEEPDRPDEWFAVGPDELTGGLGHIRSYSWHRSEHHLRSWRKRVNEKLEQLSCLLSTCKCLTELSLEALSEDEGATGPRWDYLCGMSIANIVAPLPENLTNLTLDTCGSVIRQSEQDRTPMHLCPLIAERLLDLKHVRIRMRHVCPQILQIPNKLPKVSRLKSLVVRLSLPTFPEAKYEKQDSHTKYDTQPCPSFIGATGPLYQTMAYAGVKLAKERGLDMMRVSFKAPGKHSIDLHLIDCVREKDTFNPSSVFVFEDDGKTWDPWENDDEHLMEGSDINLL